LIACDINTCSTAVENSTTAMLNQLAGYRLSLLRQSVKPFPGNQLRSNVKLPPAFIAKAFPNLLQQQQQQQQQQQRVQQQPVHLSFTVDGGDSSPAIGGCLSVVHELCAAAAAAAAA
jgi:hypothetical protein